MQADKPVFIKTSSELQKLKKGKCEPIIVDAFSNQLKELFLVENPKFSADKKVAFLSSEFNAFKKKKEKDFNYIFFPWNNHLVKCVKDKDYFKLKTNRNKDLITEDEQERLANFTIGIVGLSVGGNISTTLIHGGFSRKIKLADFDTLDTTNLNRVRAKLSDIGQEKIDIISRQIYEIDPYVKIKRFSAGLSRKNLRNFFTGNPKPKLIFEIIDDFEMKILLRKEAKKNKIPVVMLTSLGDRILIDIERYDTDSATQIFNGRVDKKVLEKILSGTITEEDKKEYAIQIVGKENLTERIISSVMSINKTLVGRPQLMSTVIIGSGIASFITRKIALGEKVKSCRTLIKFEDFIE